MRIILAAAAAALALPAAAQEVTLEMHHFAPPQAAVHALLAAPWAAKLEKDSGGRLRIPVSPALSLGGTRGDLGRSKIDFAKLPGLARVWPRRADKRHERVARRQRAFEMIDGERAADHLRHAGGKWMRRFGSNQGLDAMTAAPCAFNQRTPEIPGRARHEDGTTDHCLCGIIE